MPSVIISVTMKRTLIEEFTADYVCRIIVIVIHDINCVKKLELILKMLMLS